MTGKLYSFGLGSIDPSLAPDAWVCAVVGMAALAAAVVGGPLTMAFLALETTGDFPLSLMMLAVSTLVSVIVARLRLFLRDLAPAPEGRNDPQRPGRRLDPGPDGS